MVEIRKYIDEQGCCPYDDWFKHVRDRHAKRRINQRIDRLKDGNEGDHEPVGKGVFELRIHVGKGYRVYYAWDGLDAVLLLVGGNKSTQSEDIKTAKAYWSEYNA